MRPVILATLGLALLAQGQSAQARNIVITDDDGLTSNVVALYQALTKDGHDVVVSVPCVNQSGMGTALRIGRPVAPLREACRNDAAQAGAPGAGAMTRKGLPEGDFYYVDGTPTMAMLYGVDVVAAKRWGKAPDLVLSGPNEGQNVGAIILNSGTVSAAQGAAVRGIPAIALSAGGRTSDDKGLANKDSARIAQFSAQLVQRLDRLAGAAPLLPAGLALNVNFPDTLDGAKWQASRIGTYNAYGLRFVEDMAAASTPAMAAMAKQHGVEIPHLPGLIVKMDQDEPAAGQAQDESLVYKTAISISPMQAGYEPAALGEWANWLVAALNSGE